jgi:hypothetical protein
MMAAKIRTRRASRVVALGEDAVLLVLEDVRRRRVIAPRALEREPVRRLVQLLLAASARTRGSSEGLGRVVEPVPTEVERRVPERALPGVVDDRADDRDGVRLRAGRAVVGVVAGGDVRDGANAVLRH